MQLQTTVHKRVMTVDPVEEDLKVLILVDLEDQERLVKVMPEVQDIMVVEQ